MLDFRQSATAIGFSAVLMWSLLAALTAASGRVPPFLLTAMAFLVGGLLGLIWIARRRAWADLLQPWPAWLHGVAGLFLYHFFYFTALRNAPPVEASLIAYLWPLLIVLFSAALPGERLRWFHVAGACLGFAGAALIVSRGAGICLATAALSALAHLVLEETVWPDAPAQWLAILGLGLMPVGAAFYVWDYGMKHGDIRALGAAAYAAPVISTLVLIATGHARPTAAILAAAILIAGGAALASRDLVRRRSQAPEASPTP
jgi:drug/metabolite transporter (DMT)-like permease